MLNMHIEVFGSDGTHNMGKSKGFVALFHKRNAEYFVEYGLMTAWILGPAAWKTTACSFNNNANHCFRILCDIVYIIN
jgi:hypothetical protein